MTLLLVSFLSGILTILAPCVLPLLPVIVGGSLSGGKYRPYVITLSLILSIIGFTLLIKVSTVLIGVSPIFFTYFSGGLVIGLGIITLFPTIWTRIAEATGLERQSQKQLQDSGEKTGYIGAILTGLSLGPVFSSCSPTYSLILATVLPVSFTLGITYLMAYSIGLGLVLLLISLFGQRLIKKLKWAADPKWLFRRWLGVLFIIVGLALATGIDKKIEQGLLEGGLFDVTKLEQRLLEKDAPVGSGFGNAKPSVNISENSTPISVPIKPPFDLAYDGTVDAPELIGLQNWINSDPLTLKSLRGKVVIVDFWTYSCINCQRTLPYLKAWDKKYRDQWLVILGIHAPEFAFEKDPKNVQKAVTDAGLQYPITLDNDYKTWNAYENRYWPAKYFIDREGKLRHSHFGEGEYTESEQVIQYLLGTTGPTTTVNPVVSSKMNTTKETYLGYSRADSIVNSAYGLGTKIYTPGPIKSGEVTLGGSWNTKNERIEWQKWSTLQIRVDAKDVYLVISGNTTGKLKVSIDGNRINLSPDIQNGSISLTGDKMYHIASFDKFEKDAVVTLELDSLAGLHAFTFGS